MNFSQLFFNFNKNNANFKEEEFVELEENEKVRKFLTEFFKQNPQNQQFFTAIIKGPKFSGKSHILHIFAKKFGAKFITKKDFTKENLVAFFKKNQFYIFENIDEINDDDLLFHVFNAATENKSFLLMSTKNLAEFKLKDLVSRLKNTITTEIEELQSEESIKMLLIQGFAKKQLKINSEIIEFLSKNLNKNYQEIHETLNTIEDFCYKNKGKISLENVKKEIF